MAAPGTTYPQWARIPRQPYVAPFLSGKDGPGGEQAELMLADLHIDFIQPGNPVQNCFVESFNRTFRDDCLNMHWFLSMEDAARTIEAWRVDYYEVRPHSSLGRLTPAEFRQQHQQREEALAIVPDLPS